MSPLHERVLVTGCSGYVGRHVVRALRELKPNAQIAGLDSEISEDAVIDAYCELEISSSCFDEIKHFTSEFKPTAILHCAGTTSSVPEVVARNNVCATEIMLGVASSFRLGLPFVHLGSAAEYAEMPFGKKTSESSATAPLAVYGHSKLKATELVIDAARRGDVSGNVLRLFNPIGSGMNPETLIGKICAYLSEDCSDRLRLGPLDAYRDFFDVRDAARGVVFALECAPKIGGEIFNIASGKARTSELLLTGLNGISRVPIDFDSSAEGSIRSKSMLWQEADITKAERILGWRPKYSWEDTLRNIIIACEKMPS